MRCPSVAYLNAGRVGWLAQAVMNARAAAGDASTNKDKGSWSPIGGDAASVALAAAEVLATGGSSFRQREVAS